MAIQDTFLKDLQNKKSLENEEIFNKKLDELKVVKLETLDKIKLTSIPQGQGSGLDADYLDGKEGSSYVERYPQARFEDGSLTVPSISFKSDTDTGFYYDPTKPNAISASTQILGKGTSLVPAYSFSGDVDTGLFNYAGNTIGVVTGEEIVLLINASSIRSIPPFYAEGGTFNVPAYTFNADQDTGILNEAGDTLNITTGGTIRFTLNTASLTTTLPFLSALGSVTAPTYSFVGDANTGVHSPAGGNVSISSDGTQIVAINASGLVTIDGTVSQPGFAFKDDIDNGLLRSTTNTIALVAGGTARTTINTSTVTNTLVLLGPNGSQAAPTYSFSADTDTGINKGGANEVEITAGNTLSATCHTAGIHIRPSGAPDIELEVSNGASTGGGAIHRASSGTHSSSKIKSSISYYD